MAEKVTGTAVVDGLNFQVIEKEYRDGEVKGVFTYTRPDSWEMFKAWVGVASEETGKGIMAKWEYAHDLKERAKMREGTATQNAVVRFKKYGDVDLLSGQYGSALGEKAAVGEIAWGGEPIPLANRIAVVNAEVEKAAAKMEDPPAKYRYARAQMLETKVAKESNGKLRAA